MKKAFTQGFARIYGHVEKAGKGEGIQRKGEPLGVMHEGEDGQRPRNENCGQGERKPASRGESEFTHENGEQRACHQSIDAAKWIGVDEPMTRDKEKPQNG
ncbi:MAG TPA: hypothetical protein VKB90_16390 [Candidatus Acidoferrum sp.]|nr:hypothetical protein [Candidatus Acidoferrum sp.]